MYQGSHIEYAGYVIKPPNRDGKVIVTKDGANIMPGATWFRNADDAHAAIDILEAVGGDGQKFWHLLRALQWARKGD